MNELPKTLDDMLFILKDAKPSKTAGNFFDVIEFENLEIRIGIGPEIYEDVRKFVYGPIEDDDAFFGICKRDETSSSSRKFDAGLLDNAIKIDKNYKNIGYLYLLLQTNFPDLWEWYKARIKHIRNAK